MDNLKSCISNTHEYLFQVPLTGQRLANMTRLGIETVVRTVERKEKDSILKKHKRQNIILI